MTLSAEPASAKSLVPGPAAEPLLRALPLAYARRHGVLPLERRAGEVVVAVGTALDPVVLDDLRFLYRVPIRPTLVPDALLAEAIPRAYDRTAGTAADAVEAIESAGLDEIRDEMRRELYEPPELLEGGDEAPVIRLVNALLHEAVSAGASDIHVEPGERDLVVRFRVDGLLRSVLRTPRRLCPALASRVKIMAGLDIGERRLPQDGRFAVRVAGRPVDVRVSLVPTAFGERTVLRLLDRTAVTTDFASLGIDGACERGLRRLLALSHGLVLVTGPTGSGKTTTLYAALRHFGDGERNVMTIEDPVEFHLEGIAQTQVAPRIGLDFAAGLRSILRQDPDVVLVGEIRDRETAEIALQAALTGHLVFATLHTNDAATAATRLLDMGAEPFLITSALVAVIAQRLVRCTCTACGGTGCATSDETGFRGRTAIHEFMPVDDAIRALVMQRAEAAAIHRAAAERGMESLLVTGTRKAQAGITTMTEVLRATRTGAE
jgi:general secretion pathway protein E